MQPWDILGVFQINLLVLQSGDFGLVLLLFYTSLTVGLYRAASWWCGGKGARGKISSTAHAPPSSTMSVAMKRVNIFRRGITLPGRSELSQAATTPCRLQLYAGNWGSMLQLYTPFGITFWTFSLPCYILVDIIGAGPWATNKINADISYNSCVWPVLNCDFKILRDYFIVYNQVFIFTILCTLWLSNFFNMKMATIPWRWCK
jgi:hypothetical protein